jgi:Transketolase, C-terminal subunit
MDITHGDKEMRQEFMAVLTELADRDRRIVFLDSDLASSSGSAAFKKAHPDRFFNCGIQEANMVGVAAGLSAGGFVPFAHSFAAFMSRRTTDQIFMSCAYAKQNVRLIGSDPGVEASPNGGTHMALEDIAIMRAIPGVTILDASDPEMLRQITIQSVERPGVYYFRLTRKTKARLYPNGGTYTIGRAHLAADYGRDATIISAGFTGMVEALTAAEKLNADGIRVRVVDMFTVNPIDEAAVMAAATETGAVVTLDNHSVNGGLGSAVAEVIAGKVLVPFRRLGATTFGEVGTPAYLLEKFGMNAQAVCGVVKELLKK